MVQIKNGEIQKMQFAKEEAESQEEIEVSFFLDCNHKFDKSRRKAPRAT